MIVYIYLCQRFLTNQGGYYPEILHQNFANPTLPIVLRVHDGGMQVGGGRSEPAIDGLISAVIKIFQIPVWSNFCLGAFQPR